jgi:hypothetical protein
MIVLTLNPKKEPTAKTFPKNCVTIGGSTVSGEQQPDLSLPEEPLTACHLKIDYANGRYTVLNQANDPFSTLNGRPFGKQPLCKGDLLKVGDTEIIFDFQPDVQSSFTPPQEFVEEEQEPVKQELLPQKITLKPAPGSHSLLKKLVYGSLTFLVVIAMILGGIYRILSEQIHYQEIRAAQGVADVAMALTYAQLNQIKPPNQNWSDPEFLTANLSAVLAKEFSPLSLTNHQGEFKNSPYLLRVYTSNDHSEFLVIAQPERSILQWLTPKSVILVDSHTMVIRKISDIRELNRLLADPDNLDFNSTPAVSNLVHQGQILPLNALTLDHRHPEFAPPKELSFIRPEARNLIYNAPRYYKFSTPIIEKVQQLNRDPNHLAPLLRNIAQLTKLNHLILYSTEGQEGAEAIQQGLMPYAPSRGFLLGYLTFDGKQMAGSHLIMVSKTFTRNQSLPTPIIEASAEKNDPTSEAIGKLASWRQAELQAITREMVLLMENHVRKANGQFHDQFQELFTRYNLLNEELDEKISQELVQLYGRYSSQDPSRTPSMFMDLISSSGLDSFVKEEMRDLYGVKATADLTFQKFIDQIGEANNLSVLNQTTEQASHLLTAERFPNAEHLVLLQNQLRLAVMQRLEQLILFPSFTPEATSDKARWILLSILKNGKISDPDEREFYLTEFDKHF